MSNSQRVKILFAIVLIIMLFSVRDYIEFTLCGAYSFVVYSDKDDVYPRLEFAKSRLSHQEFHQLLTQLLSSKNQEMFSKEAAILYVYHSNDTRFLTVLKEVRVDLERMRDDSVLIIQVGPNYSRAGYLDDNSSILFSVREAIDRLQNNVLGE